MLEVFSQIKVRALLWSRCNLFQCYQVSESQRTIEMQAYKCLLCSKEMSNVVIPGACQRTKTLWYWGLHRCREDSTLTAVRKCVDAKSMTLNEIGLTWKWNGEHWRGGRRSGCGWSRVKRRSWWMWWSNRWHGYRDCHIEDCNS